ncbi:MAG: sulfotransferase [Cyclobacteriaceae bacterium]|nr:sulfotransferase [Cyclobacteriaceae bacterium]
MSPVFICGYQKSGTTLLAALLDNHPDLMVFPEETSFFRWVNIKDFKQISDRLDFQLQETHVNRLQIDKANDGMEGNRDYSDFPFDSFQSQVREVFNQGPKSHKDILLALMKAFAAVSNQQNKRYWIEKTPRNEVYFTSIKKMFPDARYIYIVRDPRDVFCSYRKNRERYTAGRATLKLGNFISTWTTSLRSGLSMEGDQILYLRYEDLVSNLQDQLEIVTKFLDVPLVEGLTIPSKLGIQWQGNSMHGDHFKAVDDRAVGRWRHSQWTKEIAVIEKILGTTMKALGYDVQSREKLPGSRDSFQLITGDRKKSLANIAWLRINGLKIRSTFN